MNVYQVLCVHLSPFGVWDLIAIVHDQFLSFYFSIIHECENMIPLTAFTYESAEKLLLNYLHK